jgi:hypothetical protein
MTVSSTSSRVIYLGNGSAMEFAFPFKVNQPADLAVVYTDAAGLDHALSPSQYAATGFGLDAGGQVTYPLIGGSPIASGTRLTIYRDVAVTQPTSLSNQGAMWPQVIEAALDRLTYVAQKVTDAVSRSLVISPTDSASLNVLPNATQRANSVLAFDGQGQPYAGTLTGSLVSVATWIADSFLPATTKQEACNALDAAYLQGSNDFTQGHVQVPTRIAGDNGTDAASTAFVATAIGSGLTSSLGGAVLRSYLAGLGMSNDSSAPNTKIDVAKGVCADDSGALMLGFASPGSIDCTSVGVNALDSGALDTNKWYHAFAIGKPDGTSGLLASLSATAPTLPSGFMFKRRIGSFKTDGSAHIVPFSQKGDEFLWKAPPIDQNSASLGVTSTLYMLSVPPGVQTNALFTGSAVVGGNASVLFQSPDQNTLSLTTQGAGSDLIVVSGTAGDGAGGRFSIRTDTSRQIRAVASTAVSLTIFTHGWIDRRGRDD